MFFDSQTILDKHDPLLQYKIPPADRPYATELMRRYRSAWDDRYTRSRNYRNRLMVLIAVVTLFLAGLFAAGGLGLFLITAEQHDGSSWLQLQWPARFKWEPSGRHALAVLVIGTLGALGGVLAGARQIVRMGGVYNPFYLPLHSLFLKIQMGALCALAGVLAILGGLAPEVTVKQWGDIAAWALVFGAAQQLVTQLVDRKVTALISSEPREQELKK